MRSSLRISVLFTFMTACTLGSSQQTTGSSAGGGSGGTSAGSGASSAGGGGNSGGTSAGGSSGAGSSCLASPLLQALGKTNVMVGFSGSGTTAAAAPFDIQYHYLAAGLFVGDTPCSSCAAATTASCDPTGAWWGCWEGSSRPVGAQAKDWVSAAKSAGEIPMFTYYELLQTGYQYENAHVAGYATFSEGPDEVTIAAKDPALMKANFADWRFLLQQIGSDVAILHYEPDFWGYAEQLNLDPHQLPAAVASANPTDCGTLENSIAGLGQCVIAMVRKYAPNARVGLHASAWASKMDVLGNTSASLDVAAEAAKTVGFLAACGASTADFIVSDISDRDAGYYQLIKGKNTWWDDTNATLPNFHQGWAFAQAIAKGLGKPLMFWQIPVGNMSLDNSNMCSQSNPPDGHFKDNRVDYIFSHMSELPPADIVGVIFGAGAGCCTTAESDSGNLIAKTNAYAKAPTAACP